MTSLLRKSFGLGAVLALLAGPALAQPYYDGGHYGPPAYSTPYHNDGWWHERQEAMWRAHERHEAWWRATHGYGYGYGYHHGDDDDHGYRGGY
jgi:hypothetical protein